MAGIGPMIQGCEPVPICADNENGRKYELGKAIFQVRRDMKLTQLEFAQMLNEDPQSIQDYESGEAIPTNQMLSKLEKALEVELQGTRLQKLMPSGEELGAFMGAFVNLTAYIVTRNKGN